MQRIILWIVCMGLSYPLLAHPHAFVEMTTKPLILGDKLMGFSMKWTLDEPSSSEMLYDLKLVQKNAKQQQAFFDESMDHIIGEHYFSYLYDQQGHKVKYTSKPMNYGLRAEGNKIQYYFDLLLTYPQTLKANKFTLSTYDPTYYVSMYYDYPAHKDAVDFSGLPHQCKGEILAPNVDQKTKAYVASLDREQRAEDPTLGAIFAQEVVIQCR